AAQAADPCTHNPHALAAPALEGKTIGTWRAATYDPGPTGPVVEPILANVKSALEAQGATVVDNTNLVFPPNYAEGQALDCEFKTDIATYLQTYVHGTNPVSGAPYPQTLADLIAFDQAHPNLEGPWNDAAFQEAEATNRRD